MSESEMELKLLGMRDNSGVTEVYKYKTDIESALFQYSKQTERYFEFTSWYDELQEVYERAGKAEEYERKAKAYDEIEQVMYENTGLGEGDEDLVNYENLLDEIEIITNDVEREAN